MTCPMVWVKVINHYWAVDSAVFDKGHMPSRSRSQKYASMVIVITSTIKLNNVETTGLKMTYPDAIVT